MVRMLLAVSDRDFLTSFSKLFSLMGYDTETTFDGTHAVSKINETAFDLVILERNIPRINSRDIIRLLREKDIPVIVISEKRISSDMLLQKDAANAYISLPFLPPELVTLASEVLHRKNDGKMLMIGDISADEKNFMLCGSRRVTSGELDVLSALSDGKEIEVRRFAPYINSLNIKLEALNKTNRIKYVLGTGYRLVNMNE